MQNVSEVFDSDIRVARLAFNLRVKRGRSQSAERQAFAGQAVTHVDARAGGTYIIVRPGLVRALVRIGGNKVDSRHVKRQLVKQAIAVRAREL
jgi:hypothetical protein